MRTFLKIASAFLASIGALTIILLLLGYYSIGNLEKISSKGLDLDKKTLLMIDLDADYSEGPSNSGISALSRPDMISIQSVTTSLRQAKEDDRIIGVIASLSSPNLGFAQIQDIRDALLDFQKSGKQTVVYSDTIGEMINAPTAYYLASAFNNIWLQPSGTVGLTGLAIEQPFLKNFLDRLGIKAITLKRSEYKSATESLTNAKMSQPNKEALESLFGSIFSQIVDGVAITRNIRKKKVKQLMAQGPLLSQEALAAGLVDHISYRDEFEEYVLTEFQTNHTLTITEYIRATRSETNEKSKKTIAIINAVGTIAREPNSQTLINPQKVISSQQFPELIKSAAENEEFDAIIIRIDSPGGSYVASDTIWRAINVAKKNDKPIIASLGNTAASGGYFIAMAADTIYAQPGTITGSIGVILNKFVFEELFKNLQINWEVLKFGDGGTLFSPSKDFSDSDLKRLNKTLDTIYSDFTVKVASSRNLSLESIQKIARGRVWSGKDAKKVGLIDHLGGLNMAIEHAKTEIGALKSTEVKIITYPPPEDPFTNFINILKENNAPLSSQDSTINFLKLLNTYADKLYILNSNSPLIYSEPITVK